MPRTIKSKPEHGVGDQELIFRMAANAIWNKLNFGRSLLRFPECLEQAQGEFAEAQALADSIVHHEDSNK